MTDAIDTSVTTDLSFVTGAGNREVMVRQAYLPPLDGRSDDYAGFDMHTAKQIGEILTKTYFAYPWKTFADTKQGVVGFSIPALMGPTLHYVINLKAFSDLTEALIVSKAGELLERMNLPRGIADQAAILWAAENKHKFQFDDKRIQ